MSFAKASSNLKENIPAAVGDDGSVLMGGYDRMELVQKVAMMVWNSTLLQWERGTAAAGGGSAATASPTTKRFDKFSATVLYVGSAAVGTAESAAGWSVQKVTFDSNGNATAALYAAGIWQDRYTLTYA